MAGSTRYHHAHVLIRQAAADDGFHNCCTHILLAKGYRQQNAQGGVVQSLDMLLEAEDGAIIDANAFKDAVTVQKSVVEHRNPCLLCGHKLPIDVHLHDVSLLVKNAYSNHDPWAHGIVAEIRSAVRIRAGNSVGYCNAGAPCAKGSCRCGCGIRLRGTATAKAATSSCPRFHTGTARQQRSGIQASRLTANPCCAIVLSS